MDRRDCSVSNGGTSIILQLCILHYGKRCPRPSLAAGGSQPCVHHHLLSPHWGMTQRDCDSLTALEPVCAPLNTHFAKVSKYNK